MIEIELNPADRNRIRNDIKLTSIFAVLFTLALIVLVFIIPLLLYFFGKPADGFAKRSALVLGGLSLPLIAVSWKNIFKYIDLRAGKKIVFKTTDYQIEKAKDGFVLSTKSPIKKKFQLYDAIADLIRPTDPIIIETTKLSTTLLFISNNTENLLEKIEKGE